MHVNSLDAPSLSKENQEDGLEVDHRLSPGPASSSNGVGSGKPHPGDETVQSSIEVIADPLADLMVSASKALELKKAVIDTIWNGKQLPDTSWLKALARTPFSFKASLDRDMSFKLRDVYLQRRVDYAEKDQQECAAALWWQFRKVVVMEFFLNEPDVMTAHIQSLVPKSNSLYPNSERFMHSTMVKVVQSLDLTSQQRDLIQSAWFEYCERTLRLMIISNRNGSPDWLVARAYAHLHRSAIDVLEWWQYIQLILASFPWLPDCRALAMIATGMCSCSICVAEKKE